MDLTISAMTLATDLSYSDVFPIVHMGANYRCKIHPAF